MINPTPLNPDALEAAADAVVDASFGQELPEAPIDLATAAISAYLAVAQPEVNSVEELNALPLGATVLGSDMIAYQMLGDASFPDGRFRETSWWAAGNEYEVTSIPLPARVLYRPEVKP